jgi:hypothetical protein
VWSDRRDMNFLLSLCRKNDEKLAKYSEESKATSSFTGGSGVLGGGAILSPFEAR